MCIILDANCFGEYVKNKDNMKPVREWVKDKGKIIFSDEEKIKEEMNRTCEMLELFNTYNKLGKIKTLPKDKVKKTIKELNNKKKRGELQSDDMHMLAHAEVGKVQLIVTRDRKLQRDFKKIIPDGKVYSRAKNKHLLQYVKCS